MTDTITIPWLSVDVWSFVGRNSAELLEHGSVEHIEALREYRHTGCICDCYLAEPTNGPEDDSDCASGPTVNEIDWSGFDPTVECAAAPSV